MSETMTETSAETYQYPHQRADTVSPNDLRMDLDLHPEQYHPGLHEHIENFLDRNERDALTAELVRNDALDRLMQPESERIGTEVIDTFTGEVRKPCFELEIDDTARQEVAAALKERSEGLAVVHALLDSLPPMSHGKLRLESLPFVESIDPYVDKVTEVYQQWTEEKAMHEALVVDSQGSYTKDNPFGDSFGETPVRLLRANVSLTALQYDGESVSRGGPNDKNTTAEAIISDVVESHMQFTDQRARLEGDMRTNCSLVETGQWPGEDALQAIERSVQYGVPGSYAPELSRDDAVRQAIVHEIGNKIGKSDTALERVVSRAEISWATDIRRKIIPGHRNGGLGILNALGLVGAELEVEDTRRCGDLADVYLSPEDVAAYGALGERIDTMFAEPGFTSPSETQALRPEHMANRVVDFSQQLIPEGASLIHATKASNIEDVIHSGALQTRFATNRQFGEGAQGDHSNFVHFAEPGKANHAYGEVFLAVPIEEVIAATPYLHQEANYKGNELNVQERYGAITLNVADMPLAAQLRLADLNDKFAGGLVAEATGGHKNNLSFAASQEATTAAQYGYPLGKTKVICSPESFSSIQQAIEANPNSGLRIEDLSAYTPNNHTNSPEGFVFETASDPAAEQVVVYGPLRQTRVGFSESELRLQASTDRHVSQAEQRVLDRQRKLEMEFAERTKQEAQQAGLSIEAYEAQKEQDRVRQKQVDALRNAAGPIQIPSDGSIF